MGTGGVVHTSRGSRLLSEYNCCFHFHEKLFALELGGELKTRRCSQARRRTLQILSIRSFVSPQTANCGESSAQKRCLRSRVAAQGFYQASHCLSRVSPPAQWRIILPKIFCFTQNPEGSQASWPSHPPAARPLCWLLICRRLQYWPLIGWDRSQDAQVSQHLRRVEDVWISVKTIWGSFCFSLTPNMEMWRWHQISDRENPDLRRSNCPKDRHFRNVDALLGRTNSDDFTKNSPTFASNTQWLGTKMVRWSHWTWTWTSEHGRWGGRITSFSHFGPVTPHQVSQK